jgi:MYXO-CTERM domain-containing protein
MSGLLALAFCGFYVSGSGAKLVNDATQVVLVRDGTRTVLAMQNDYKGPLEDFAMVVPVPVVLKQQDVKTLPKTVFEHVESLGSPRLVEYWEEDPCPIGFDDVNVYGGLLGNEVGEMTGGFGYGRGFGAGTGLSVGPPPPKIEAKFDVAEYKVIVLSATDSAGLEIWLDANGYKVPEAAKPLLRPYVEAGSKFFVAKVDPKKVKMVDGHAALSPIRFHYDSDEFSLPIRLGLASAGGKQDLIVNIISKDTRYEVANYKNVYIPTNFDVRTRVRDRFAEFYAALFDKTIEMNPRAVVTEYAWTAKTNYHCDPCPEYDVTRSDLALLGDDVVGADLAQQFVMTRLHARYSAKDMKDDLRFRAAKPVTGGREEWSKTGLEYGANPSEENYFQARYAIRHFWTGPIKCKAPTRNVWGGPPNGNDPGVRSANKLAFAPRGRLALGDVIKRDLWEIGFKKTRPQAPASSSSTPPVKTMSLGIAGLLALLLLERRRSRRRE